MEQEAAAVQQEIPELCVENPKALADVEKPENKATSDNGFEFYYKPPRLFRQSIIVKTWKLFKTQDEQQLIEKKPARSLRENVWWLLIMIIGFIFAFAITDKAWHKFQTNPTITSLMLNEKFTRMTYPTVSVCPESSASEAKVDSFVRMLGLKANESREIEELLKAIPSISYGPKGLKAVVLSDSVDQIAEHLTNDVRSLAFKLVKSCSDIFTSCRFKGRTISCCSAFLPFLSERGLCWSFNSKKFSTPQEDFFNMNLLAVEEFDDTSLSMELEVPAKLYLNSHEESLYFEQTAAVKTKLDSNLNLIISMQSTKTHEKVHDLKIHQRNCVYGNEVKLKHLTEQSYSYSACLSDCKIDQALKLCGCLPPFHRTRSMNNSTFCDIDSLKCLKDPKILDLAKCGQCELPCDFTTFSIDSLQIDSNPSSNTTKVVMNFNHWPLVFFQREVRFGFVDFLVAFGSILALFLGFSLLSAIEILFYFIRFAASKFSPKQN